MYNENYYRGVYKDYDFHNPPEKLLFYRSIIEKLAPKKENIKMLDLGCAFGNFLASLNPKWMRFGIDVSNFAINKAKKRYRDVQFRNGDLTIIPFEEVFDIIVAFDTLEHIVDCDVVITTPLFLYNFSFYSPLFDPEVFHLPLIAILFEPVLSVFMPQSGCFFVVNKGFIKIAIMISNPQVVIGHSIIRI